DKWAKIISFMFDGSFISIPVFIIICMIVVEDKMAALSWALLCILFGMMIPFLYVFFLYRKNKIYDIHIPEKNNRMKPLLFTLLSYITGLIVLYLLDAPPFLKVIFILTIISASIYTVITYYWKISMHASYITFIVITFNILLGPWMLLLLPLIPIVGWARVRAKRHTKPQVLTGAGLASVICVLVYNFYGFIGL
ncbi:MAG: hypothetical protein K8S14_01605, partial [Actinomycetia bacterium]|nr:hypothetical protein [Actinomycetes bacterium]